MKKKGNYKLFANHAYAPATSVEILFSLMWFFIGYLLANGLAFLAVALTAAMDVNMFAEINMATYPVMFIPAMIYIGYISNRNSFSESGYALDNNHFGKLGGVAVAFLAAIATLFCGVIADGISSILPPMPDNLVKMMESMTNGNLIVNLLSVSVLAPIFEEWLCRGILLRGLLTFGRRGGRTGIRPVWAIILSSAFFAFIHMNPWQALAAFIFGMLFGYIYYLTGSLKLTMFMHFVNNTTSVFLSRLDSLETVDSWMDIVPSPYYWLLFAASAAIVAGISLILWKKVAPQSHQGSCDELSLGI